ncbi:CBS domain-containing protein [Curtobacterium flaccumfaciens]|uniref:CBS domain-containing protein n=1 Tax=Curtobacterium flaccumfaciens TaxID=2035 RepID=UPI001367234B|nr:CBS domain-containing protein [Curtobacterium flaccumfaciens]MBT1664184.1 hypothetical protein [Curtobacterium flaccumfaciens pv. flaccumfaciens]QFS79068.2 CBS domain-containing protein [Curtobacterium flaccumfaciens pv. flaccumfaciens]
MPTQAPTEPSDFTEEMCDDQSIAGLNDFLARVERGSPWRIATERLLRLNGNSRRGRNVNQQINDHLRERGLVCKPPLEVADYYGSVVISDPRDDVAQPDSIAALPISAFRGDLPHLISYGPDTSANKVQTRMISEDISQIPILSNDKKNLQGVTTWRSIAQYRGELSTAKASDIMGSGTHVASSSDDFLELTETIIAQEYVLYRAPDGRIDGIVTASDLALAFNGTAGMYIQLQELESRLRILLDKSPLPSLQKHLEPRRRTMEKFRGATDMMFGEYLNALDDEEIWAASGIHLDKAFCLKLLGEVKDVRNGVMHFSATPEDDTETEVKQKETVTKALRILRFIPLN